MTTMGAEASSLLLEVLLVTLPPLLLAKLLHESTELHEVVSSARSTDEASLSLLASPLRAPDRATAKLSYVVIEKSSS